MNEAGKETVMIGRILIVGAAMLLATGAAHAQAVRKAGDISYLSGGVGKPEREQFKALEKNFNLKLVFAVADGKFLANVRVVVSDAQGRKLLEHVADGPFFLARLPAGEYSVAATIGGKTQTRRIKVTAGRLHTEHLRWSGSS
jgi:hypothetical protein